MTDKNVFALAQSIKAAGTDPSDVIDAIWNAGYRQPPRTAQEAAQITIDTFFYCYSYDMPTDLWPKTYDSVLQNELMKAVLGDNEGLCITDPVKVARAVFGAGFSKEADQ